ncbi:hypothetical protein K488DRAFT_71846 [Vararia minispora EC-137]|uniref:Uncharacterized protein n=1 Tax=Vararia minispora EC-137 TaxID=1314806 RepID=A0ACB8QGZ6_9AGAM|nr:hypothetical protein K488DRAFT_71846 [Vararia minispora EC-137]
MQNAHNHTAPASFDFPECYPCIHGPQPHGGDRHNLLLPAPPAQDGDGMRWGQGNETMNTGSEAQRDEMEQDTDEIGIEDIDTVLYHSDARHAHYGGYPGLTDSRAMRTHDGIEMEDVMQIDTVLYHSDARQGRYEGYPWLTDGMAATQWPVNTFVVTPSAGPAYHDPAAQRIPSGQRLESYIHEQSVGQYTGAAGPSQRQNEIEGADRMSRMRGQANHLGIYVEVDDAATWVLLRYPPPSNRG